MYHVTVRGNARQDLFLDDRDRERFIKNLAASVASFGTRLHLYCLMANHLHLVVETPRANLSRFMGSLLTGYSVYFNLRHDRAGHLTQGRYGAQLVERDEYLLRLSRYVHLQPVCTKAMLERSALERRKGLRDYVWSSYRSYAGLAHGLDFFTYNLLLAMTARPGVESREAYRERVETRLADTDEELELMLKSPGHGVGGA